MFKRKIRDSLEYLLLENYRKPILLQGVRQCGKTTLINDIIENHNHAYINLERDRELTELFKEINLVPNEIITSINLYFNKEFDENTIFFFDEIQNSPQMITALKYFAESSTYRVVASGSNLGTTIFRENYSFPVGYVNLLTMFPLDFDEFLWASDKSILQIQLLEAVKKGKINSLLHNMLVEEYRNYLIVGGLPEVVDSYINNENYEKIQEMLILAYENDFTKYAHNNMSLELITLWKSIGVMIARDNQKFQAKLLKKGSTINMWNEKVQWLENNGLINKVNAINSVNIPIASNIELNKYKLFYFDVGLLTKMFNYKKIAMLKENDKIFLGILSENYVANALSKIGHNSYYYSKRTSEVDFVIEYKNKIIPIEVKSSYNTKAKSLNLLLSNNNLDLGVISSLKHIDVNKPKISIPLYAIHLINEILDELLES